jgi:hypothetical protein
MTRRYRCSVRSLDFLYFFGGDSYAKFLNRSDYKGTSSTGCSGHLLYRAYLLLL